MNKLTKEGQQEQIDYYIKQSFSRGNYTNNDIEYIVNNIGYKRWVNPKKKKPASIEDCLVFIQDIESVACGFRVGRIYMDSFWALIVGEDKVMLPISDTLYKRMDKYKAKEFSALMKKLKTNTDIK